MLVLAALLAAAQPGVLPERELLDAFKAACARTGDVAAMKQDALGSGWAAIEEGADPRIAKLLKLGREATQADGTVEGAVFRRTLSDRELFLVVSRFEDRNGVWGVGCRLYDFGAASPLTPKVLKKWMGRAPTGSEGVAEDINRLLWEPGWHDGLTIEVTHVPQGHPVSQSLGLSGNILVAQAIGGF
jgi:hypothetical protein